MKVLVVDDILYSRKLLSSKLEALGHEVIEAGDGEEAVRKSKSENPDVVFMDVVMPKMDGITATKIIKNSTGSKIIMCSAVNDKNHIIEAIKAGAVDYISKPLNDIRIADAIRRL
ncbi:MAG: response regulator [Clostridia bacterium]|nr:response regulator [Clostridia bacterium]